MVYRLVSLIESQAVPSIDFETAQAAIAFARDNGLKARPEIVVDSSWIEREAARLGNGFHEALPWRFQSFWDYDAESMRFAHVAKKDPIKIAFTESPEKGMRDIQTVLTPGRYLERFYSDRLSSEEIRDLARSYATRLDTPEFCVARLSSEIVSIYRNGPNSCMSLSLDSYQSDVHPVSVYGYDDESDGPDSALVLAYLRIDQRITARALISERDKTHMRLYGDTELLRKSLNAAGYHSANPFGYTVKAIEYSGSYVMPYIDAGETSGYGAADVKMRSGRFVICESGDHTAGETCGLLSEPEPEPEGEYCEYYEETRDEESYTVIVSDDGDMQSWCETACDNYATRLNGRYYSDEIVRSDGHGNSFIIGDDNYSYCDRTDEFWPSDEMVYCDASGEYYHESVCIEVKTIHGTTHLSVKDADANSFTCLIDGETWHNDARHADFLDIACIHEPTDLQIEELALIRVNHFPHPDQHEMPLAA